MEDILYKKYMEASKRLKSFPKGRYGITPDEVKAKPEWQAAKKDYDTAFRELREYNFNKKRSK